MFFNTNMVNGYMNNNSNVVDVSKRQMWVKCYPFPELKCIYRKYDILSIGRFIEFGPVILCFLLALLLTDERTDGRATDKDRSH